MEDQLITTSLKPIMITEPKAEEKKFIETFHVKPQYYQDLPILMRIVDLYNKICHRDEIFMDFTKLSYLHYVSSFQIDIEVEKEYIDCIEIRYTKNENNGPTFFCCLSSSDRHDMTIARNTIEDLEVKIINLFSSVINKILS